MGSLFRKKIEGRQAASGRGRHRRDEHSLGADAELLALRLAFAQSRGGVHQRQRVACVRLLHWLRAGPRD
jgi:hypothetical protein